MIEEAKEDLQKYMDKRLKKHGWRWNLISTLSENITRVQIAPDGEFFEDRITCFNGKTLEDAVEQAEQYIQKNKIT